MFSSPWARGKKLTLELPVKWDFVSSKCKNPHSLGYMTQKGWEDGPCTWLTSQALGV